jgi:hypothetical protein
MSLKQFLAVGKSFEDMPEGKSPFEMRDEVRLPRFENEQRFTARRPVLVQTDWLAGNEHRLADPKGAAKPRKIIKTRRKMSWLRILTFGLFGRKEKFTGHLVQEEMKLENVRVMRNDLADADLEVVVNKRKKFALRAAKAEAPAQAERGNSGPPVEAEGTKTEPQSTKEDTRGQECPRSTRPKRYEWSELTVRLFEIGQH